jgi:hypothetical protein
MVEEDTNLPEKMEPQLIVKVEQEANMCPQTIVKMEQETNLQETMEQETNLQETMEQETNLQKTMEQETNLQETMEQETNLSDSMYPQMIVKVEPDINLQDSSLVGVYSSIHLIFSIYIILIL